MGHRWRCAYAAGAALAPLHYRHLSQLKCFDRDWDKRHPPDGVACQGNSRVMILIRHGQYENKGGPGYGQLTALGREQARQAGRHLVARAREDPKFKKALLRMTSSALDRAVETADLIEAELRAEIAWVDVEQSSLPGSMPVREAAVRGEGEVEYVAEPEAPVVVEDPKNWLQPRVEVCRGSRLRVLGGTPGAATLAAALAGPSARVAVHQELRPARLPPASRFGEWECSGCGKERPGGDIHWSDDAENNGLGFCSACRAAGPRHRKLREGDTLARVTKGSEESPFRMPNDPNLNEADVDSCSVLMPDDPLFEDYGVVNAAILRDHAQVEAAFYRHFHRSLDHNRLSREARADVVVVTFTDSGGKQSERRLSKDEFSALEIATDGSCAWIWDEKVKHRTQGAFAIETIGDTSVKGMAAEEIRDVFERLCVMPRPGSQVEILVCHQNIIRYFFLRAMQFDTRAWLNLGGSNCTMTQLRITRRGDVICDFMFDHGSQMPVSHYTFNKHPDV